MQLSRAHKGSWLLGAQGLRRQGELPESGGVQTARGLKQDPSADRQADRLSSAPPLGNPSRSQACEGAAPQGDMRWGPALCRGFQSLVQNRRRLLLATHRPVGAEQRDSPRFSSPAKGMAQNCTFHRGRSKSLLLCGAQSQEWGCTRGCCGAKLGTSAPADADRGVKGLLASVLQAQNWDRRGEEVRSVAAEQIQEPRGGGMLQALLEPRTQQSPWGEISTGVATAMGLGRKTSALSCLHPLPSSLSSPQTSMSVSGRTTRAASTSASTSPGTTAAPATTASAWRTTATTA